MWDFFPPISEDGSVFIHLPQCWPSILRPVGHVVKKAACSEECSLGPWDKDKLIDLCRDES